ncbi:hypothetical protein JOE57_001890 [Microlunatus panaciterrae]|uniref:Uncharacterized protein n=1 Tax=Microlunatus panaciterrae TaxID=400768 RepID=A0ABS2RJ01_9ACTN|nr:hypothetical protein [Microlunatus panaciterrae]MBM7798969.1 hypothetical protein [Microlunatus panaciterrae]
MSRSLSGPTVEWALGRLDSRLQSRGLHRSDGEDGDGPLLRISPAVEVAEDATPHAASGGVEAFDYVPEPDGSITIAAGGAIGAAYGLIGLGDRVSLRGSWEAALDGIGAAGGSPAVPVRGIVRSFSSVDEDLPWFRDHTFWTEYLDWMAESRFNRFHLALGMQYNYGADRHGATDNYLCFAYPFLLEVDGWDVTADGVTPEERDENLQMLRFISAETKRRGMSFQLGLWNHAYDYGRDSRHRYEILGLTPETHGDYSAAALAQLLAECPDIDGLTFRVHYEGGIHDQDHEIFWEKVFAGASGSGRSLEIDMHAKGVDKALLDAAAKPNLRPVLSAKYWAEHQGLPYHQASIRRREEAKPIPPGHEMTGVTEFSRRFTRYGYADFLSEDREAELMFRVWPGTQKLLLWGDPEQAAGYGRLATFGGSQGVDVCEPLFFKGRKGSGVPGGRDPYIAPDLQLGLADWTKYRYTYLVWGRMLFNPDAPADEWRAFLTETYGDHADSVERALSPLSRILPLVTVVHGVGGSNNGYWPEIYTNLPITSGVDPGHYGSDTDSPPVWGTVSPFDPTTFYIINEYAKDLVDGTVGARYTPWEVAQWLEGFVAEAEEHLSALRLVTSQEAQFRRTVIDLEVLSCLGRFFAAKFRSATQYGVYQQCGSGAALRSAVAENVKARDAFATILDRVEGIYQEDLKFGDGASEHGHWALRLPAVERDLQAMKAELDALQAPSDVPAPAHPLRAATSGIRHTPPEAFRRGEDLAISLDSHDATVRGVTLCYRHVNQAEHYQTATMQRSGDSFEAVIPAAHTGSSYPLMYFFDVDLGETRSLHPRFNAALSNQPYHVIFSEDRRP